jgi:hypothetical protein
MVTEVLVWTAVAVVLVPALVLLSRVPIFPPGNA